MSLIAVYVFALYLCHANGETDKKEPIQTFVIPHSHMDVGWVYTIQVGFCCPVQNLESAIDVFVCLS